MKDHLGVVFLGDCTGKSTLIGQLLLKEGSNSKFRKQQNNGNKETFAQYFEGLTNKDQSALKYSALILKKLEIQSGRTIEFHNERFNTERRVYSLIDTPSQRVYLKNMVAGITFASAIVLVLSVKENEMEKELTNNIKDQLTIAYTMGIKQIVCCINKMETINWSKEKFDEIVKQMDKYLQMVGFHPKLTKYIPISAYQQQNIFKLSEHTPWYIGSTLVGAFDEFITFEKQKNMKEYLISVLESHYNNEQCIIIGRIEEGTLKIGQKMNINGKEVECLQIERYNEIIPQSTYGDIVGFKLSAVVNKVKRGTIISSNKQICSNLQAQFLILDGQGLKTGVMMCFYFCTQVIECSILIEKKIQRHTGNVLEENPKKLNQGDTAIIKVIPHYDLIADIYSQTNCLGRFVVIMNQKLIGVGFVKDIVFKK